VETPYLETLNPEALKEIQRFKKNPLKKEGSLEAIKINKIRQDIENLTRNTELLALEADGFPAISQNTQRLKACIRMMEMALGQVTMSPGKNP